MDQRLVSTSPSLDLAYAHWVAGSNDWSQCCDNCRHSKGVSCLNCHIQSGGVDVFIVEERKPVFAPLIFMLQPNWEHSH